MHIRSFFLASAFLATASTRVLPLAALAVLPACNLFDDDEADLAGLIGTQFVPVSIDASGVADGVLTSQSQVAAASFLTAVKQEFSRDFERIELSAVRVKIQNPIVGAWSELYSGEVSLAFIPASNPAAIVVAKGTPPSGVGTFTFEVTSGKNALDAFPDITAGNFKVRLSGPTPKLATDSFAQAVVLEIEFLVF